MSNLLRYIVFAVLILPPPSTWAFPQSGLDLGGSRRRRDAPCRENTEYLYNNICCLNCPAGTHMKLPCTRAGEMGECEECDYLTYTEHSNGLKQCFKCTQCRSDQQILRQCSQIQDTECQCKMGRFCAPDQACEVCKKCSRCEKDEEIVRNCTSTTDTECKKIQSKSTPASANASMIRIIVLLIVTTSGFIVAISVWWKRCRARDSQRNLADGLKAGDHHTEEKRNGQTRILNCSNRMVRAKSSAATEDECKELCESLSSSASNSQYSLTSQPSSAFPASLPQASPVVSMQPNKRDDDQFPKLVPVNGEESLRKCFGFFEELDFNYVNRFFRHLGISDNVIKSKENLLYEDRIHELLNIWVEKEGRDASLNDLLKVLLNLSLRRTAENIKENAIKHGHYTCENSFSEQFSENM